MAIYSSAPVWISLLVGFLFHFSLFDTLILAIMSEAAIIFMIFLSGRLNFELFRKITHIVGILFIIYMVYANADRNLLLLVIGIAAALSLPVYICPIRFPDTIKNLAVKSVRSGERSIRCVTHFLVAAFIMLLFLPYSFVILGFLIALIGDPVAFIVGTRYGKRKIVGEKTLEGSLAFFICVLFAMLLLGINFATAVVLAFTGAVVEHVTVKYLDDNATVPIVTSFVYYLVFLV